MTCPCWLARELQEAAHLRLLSDGITDTDTCYHISAADDPRFSSPPTQKAYFDCRLCSLIFIVIIFYCIYIYF